MNIKTKNIIVQPAYDNIVAYMDNISNTGMRSKINLIPMMGSKLMLEQLSEKAIIFRRHHKNQGTFKARQRKGFYLWRCLAIM